MKLTRLATLAALLLVGACRNTGPALNRGDLLWADSSYSAAIAEYRLDVRRDDSREALVKLAHAYARTRQPEQAREVYTKLVAKAPQYRDQAVYDFLRLADEALKRGDRAGMAAAVDEVVALRPTLPLPGFYLPLARFYARNGDRARARDYFLRALSVVPGDSAPPILLEVGRLTEALGDCDEAIGFYEAFAAQRSGEEASEALWRAGSCAFALARREQDAGELQKALAHFDKLIELGTPGNLLGQAWFQEGEILFLLGENDRAMAAFGRAIEVGGAEGQIGERAMRRIQEIMSGATPPPRTETPPPPAG